MGLCQDLPSDLLRIVAVTGTGKQSGSVQSLKAAAERGIDDTGFIHFQIQFGSISEQGFRCQFRHHILPNTGFSHGSRRALKGQGEHGHSHFHPVFGVAGGTNKVFLPTVVLLGHFPGFVSQDLQGNFHHFLRLHITHNTQVHIPGGIKSPVAQMQLLRGNLADGFQASQNGHPDGMLGVHGAHQIFKHTAVRGILIHADLLGNDPLLFFHALLRKVGSGHKFKQQLQAPVKVLCAGEIVGGHVIAGESIGDGAQSGKLCGHISFFRHMKQSVLQIMGNARRHGMLLAFKGKFRMNSTKIRNKVSQLLGKVLSGHHMDGESIGELCAEQDLIQLFIENFFHGQPPFSTYWVCSFTVLAASTTSSAVTQRIFSI